LANKNFSGPSIKLISTEGTELNIQNYYRYGHLDAVSIDQFDTPIFIEPPSIDLLVQAKNLLQKYSTFKAKYCEDNSFLVPMQDILNNLGSLSPKEITVGNINFQVIEKTNKTRIIWYYTAEGVPASAWKRVEIELRGNVFESFQDSWSIFKVSGPSAISSEEAVRIASEAAKKLELRAGNENGTIRNVKVPDLSNASYDVDYFMYPYTPQEDHFPSRLLRDPLTIYPNYQIHFYFEEKIAGCSGVQVGVWGDTGEVLYCSGYGYLGTFGLPDNQDAEQAPSNEDAVQTPDNQVVDENEQTELSRLLNLVTIAVAVGIVIFVVMMVVVVVLRRKNRVRS
jgi:hypothetical protein